MASNADEELQLMLDDSQHWFGNASISVMSINPGAMNFSTGIPAAGSDVADSVSAIRSERVLDDVAMGGASAGIVEVEYRVRVSDLSFTPKKGDTITDGGSTLKIAEVDKDVNDLAWVLRCRTNKGP